MKYVAILRGINVGGKRKILMKDLREQLTDAGFQNVTTYIQSGNVVFDYSGPESTSEIADRIERIIDEIYGFKVPVIVWTSEELHSAINSNPYHGDYRADHLHLTFLKDSPGPGALEEIEDYDFPPDHYRISGKRVFIFIAGRYSDSKLSNNFFEKKLKVNATTRNWKTVLELGDLTRD